MLLPLILWAFLAQRDFAAHLEDARTHTEAGEWKQAAAALDAAQASDAALFEANNLHYWRGRAAEAEEDWRRASREFQSIPPASGLRPLAAWHEARAAIRLGDLPHASLRIAELPVDFPSALRLQLAREAPADLALPIYEKLNTRAARFEHARLLNDIPAMWTLLHERNSDDVGLQCARLLAPVADAPREALDVGNAFLAQRDFGSAIALFRRAGIDPAIAAEALYQTARAFFLSEDYPRAIDAYQDVVERFPASEWKREAEYQIASCFWRMGRYADADKAYSTYIARYGDRSDEGATRNLVDVYRVSGQSEKAVALIDRKLAGRATNATRQALTLVKAKILYSQGKFAAARDLFHQLGTLRLVSTPGGGTTEEVRYFEALSQARLGNLAAAQAMWKTLAADPLSYFGRKSAERLGAPKDFNTDMAPCAASDDAAVQAAQKRIAAVTRPMRTAPDPSADAVADLLFMRLWDEAFIWFDRVRRPDARTAADLAYLAGRYDRAISYADRLPESDSATWPFLYPAAYRQLMCAAATSYKVDPFWLHAIIWVESKYDPTSNSAASARGLMQFIPETAHAVGDRIGLQIDSQDQLYRPQTSILLGAAYWAELMAEFKLPELALAAYNGGPDNVRRWRAKLPNADVEFFVSDIGFVESKRYVELVFSARAAYERSR